MGLALAASSISQNWGCRVGSPRDLHQVRLALGNDKGVEHGLDGFQAAMACALDRAVGEADRAGQVAGLVDLENGQTGVLLVIRTQAAIMGTAMVGPGLGGEGPVAGLHPVPLGLPVADVVADQGFLDPVFLAALLVEDLAILTKNLGGNQFETGLTQAGGLSQEQIGRGLAPGHV